MKTKFILLSTFTLLLGLVSCNEAPTSINDPYQNPNTNNTTGFNWTTTGTTTGGTTGTTTSGTTTGTTTSGTTTGTTTSGSTTGTTTGTTTSGTTTGTTTSGTTTSGSSGTGSTCYGTTLDGDSSGNFPLFVYDLKLRGQTNWTPGDGALWPAAPNINEVMFAMQSDTRYKVRVKVLPQPSSCTPTPTSGAASYPHYTKLRYTLRFHTLVTDNSGNIVTPHQLNPPFYEMADLGPVDTNSCGELIDVPHSNVTGPVIIQVANVKTDFGCMWANLPPEHSQYGWYCPAEQLARTQSCWHMKLQISTDITDNFQ